MAGTSSDSGRSDRGAGGDSSRRPYSGFERLIAGSMLVLAVLFALGGAAQIGLAVFFLLRGHPALVVPREQPAEELSISLGGWLPLGACGVVMLTLAWVTRHIRRSLRGEANT